MLAMAEGVSLDEIAVAAVEDQRVEGGAMRNVQSRKRPSSHSIILTEPLPELWASTNAQLLERDVRAVAPVDPALHIP